MQRDGCEEHETGAAQTVQGRWQGLPLQGRIFFFLLARDDQSQALKKKKVAKKNRHPGHRLRHPHTVFRGSSFVGRVENGLCRGRAQKTCQQGALRVVWDQLEAGWAGRDEGRGAGPWAGGTGGSGRGWTRDTAGRPSILGTAPKPDSMEGGGGVWVKDRTPQKKN